MGKLSEEIRQWIYTNPGFKFTARFLYGEFDLQGIEKDACRGLLTEMHKRGELEKSRGFYRFADKTADKLDWQSADMSNVVNLKWPFELEKYIIIYPKNIIVVAGAPDSGKTAFCFNVIRLNMSTFTINYYNSEMGAAEMLSRISNFNGIEPDEWHFNAYERSVDFADIIKPNDINIIDYLEIVNNFYEIAGDILAIHNNLRGGIAIICIQKNPKVDLGRGGSFGLEKPRLYLSMDNNQLKIVKGKNWKDHSVNPNKMTWTFQLVGGARFVNPIGPTYEQKGE